MTGYKTGRAALKLLASAVAVFGAVPIPAAHAVERRVLSASERRAVETAVTDGLRDPFSARFRLPSVVSLSPGRVMCGYVNAKNAFGAYVGWRLFYGQQIVSGGHVVGFDIIRLHEADDPAGSVQASLGICRVFDNAI